MRTALIDISKEWDDLGEALGIAHSEIEKIQANNPKDIKQCLKEVVDLWFKLKGNPPSWKSLCEALRDPLVGRKDVALAIEKTWISN